MQQRGSLTVVGTGIKAIAHVTQESVAYMQMADKLFYLVCEPITAAWVKSLNPSAESLYPLYKVGRPRMETYMEMVDVMLSAAGAGKDVCAAFYGHPGVFAFPTHEALRRARQRGIVARMIPGISAEDCLFADLGIDPATAGCQSFEATDFLVRRRVFDVSAALILWQIAVIREANMPGELCNREGLAELASLLLRHYGPEHEVIIYEAAQLSLCAPRIDRLPLRDLADAPAVPVSTLYVPPLMER